MNEHGDHPVEILGHRVLGLCPECDGEGLQWCLASDESTHWAERCKNCNCVGYLLDFRYDPPKPDDDVPF